MEASGHVKFLGGRTPILDLMGMLVVTFKG